jgi:hypothetical protein
MGAFDLELREARRMIREHRHYLSEFTLTRAPKKSPGGQLSLREYIVTVTRERFPPATYEGGDGKYWVVQFQLDLDADRFGQAVDSAGPTP